MSSTTFTSFVVSADFLDGSTASCVVKPFDATSFTRSYAYKLHAESLDPYCDSDDRFAFFTWFEPEMSCELYISIEGATIHAYCIAGMVYCFNDLFGKSPIPADLKIAGIVDACLDEAYEVLGF